MKIALLQLPAAPLNVELCGGLERTIIYELDLLRKAGHEVYMYVSRLAGDHPYIRTVKDLNNTHRILKFIYFINFGVHTRDFDILHGHYTPALALLFPRRSCIHYQGLAHWEIPLYRYFRGRAHRAHYIFCARHVMESFREKYPDIPQSHLHILYNGADTAFFSPPEKKTHSKIKRICFYAGWIPEKGLFQIIDAARLLEAKRRDFEVVFGGSAFSHYKKNNEQAIKLDAEVRGRAAGLRSIKFIGDIYYKDLPELLRGMDIGLAPSIDKDPFPLVPLEMMASGLPVVGFNIGGITESVINGKTGLLVENMNVDHLASALENLIANDTLRLDMGKAAREHVVKNFTWDRHLTDLLAIYKKIGETA